LCVLSRNSGGIKRLGWKKRGGGGLEKLLHKEDLIIFSLLATQQGGSGGGGVRNVRAKAERKNNIGRYKEIK